MVELKKGAWSPEEDRRLISYIAKYGIWTWSQMPKFAGVARTGKSCRLRWINYLRPDVKRGPFSVEEVEIIVRMFLSIGHRWSAIAAQLPGRTDNDIKNFYHAHLKKNIKPVNALGRKKTTNNSKMKKKKKNNNNNVVMPAEEKPRHDQRGGTTSLVVLDSNNPDGFGNPSFARDQQLHHHHNHNHHYFSSSSSATMDNIMSSLSLEDYDDEIKSFWYNLLNQAEDLKF